MTGRQAGFCAGLLVPGYATPVWPRGRGLGRRFRWGGDRGWGRGEGSRRKGRERRDKWRDAEREESGGRGRRRFEEFPGDEDLG